MKAKLFYSIFIGILIASFNCATTKGSITERKKEPLKTEVKKEEEEELTEKKVEIPKEPQFVEGIDKDAQILFKDALIAVFSSPPEYSNAVSKLESAIQKDKQFLEAYFNLGMVYERTGKEELALETYKRALNENPLSLDAKAYIGKIYLAKAKKEMEMGDFSQAELLMAEAKRLFDEIIKEDPDNIAANNAIALFWLIKKDLKTAEDYVKKVLMLQPRNVTALNTRGLIFYLNQNYKFAEWIFKEKVLKEDPNSTEALNNLGLTYIKLDKIPLAVEYFKKAIEVDRDNIPAKMNLASIYLNYLNYEEAEKLYKEVLLLQNDNIEAIIGVGSSLYGLQKFEDAAMKYESAYNLNPQNHELLMRCAKLYETKLNNLEKAISYYEKYINEKNIGENDPIVQKVKILKQLKEQAGLKMPEPSVEGKEGEAGTEESTVGVEGEGTSPTLEPKKTEEKLENKEIIEEKTSIKKEVME